MSLGPAPMAAPIADKQGSLTAAWRAWLSALFPLVATIGANGSTAMRPVGTGTVPLFVGQPYFDTTLGYPVWIKSLNPTVWVNATGAPV